MITKTIKFEDLDGNEVSKDFMFHMTKLELAETDLYLDGGFEGMAKRLTKANDVVEAYKIFKGIILQAYGKRSEDRSQFIKNDQIRAELEFSPALGELILELMEDTTAAANFIKGLMPKSVQDAVEDGDLTTGEVVKNVELPAGEPKLDGSEPAKFEDFTDDELLAMNDETFKALLPPKGQRTARQLNLAQRRKQV